MPESAIPAYITSLIRHFEDLRDGTHGGSASRKDKEAHFESEVQLLAPVARQVLTEMNTSLLLDTGQLNVFSDEDAAAQLSILRAIASSDLHNLVFRADYRIVPAVTAHPATPLTERT